MLFTNVEIQQNAANFLEFQRGRMLADQGSVTELKREGFWKGETALRGWVTEAGVDYRIFIATKEGRLSDYFCTCSHFHREQGLCRHLAASLIYYRKKYQSAEAGTVSTSRSGRRMLERYREKSMIFSQDTTEKVAMEPILTLQNGKAELEFRLGVSRMYILKDLGDFCEKMKTGAEGTYGKNFHFLHSMEAFDPVSAKAVDFIMKYMEQCAYFRNLGTASLFPSAKIRAIPLTGAAADEWFTAMRGSTLSVYWEQQLKVMAVREEDPCVTAVIVRKEPDGYGLSVQGTWRFLYGLDRIYACDGEHFYICGEAFSRDTRDFFMAMTGEFLLDGREIFFQERDFRTFCARVLPFLKERLQFEGRDVDLDSLKPQRLTTTFWVDSPDRENIVCRFQQAYGEFAFLPLDPPVFPATVRRDIMEEMRVHAVVREYFSQKDADGNLVIYGNEEKVYRLLSQGLGKLGALGEVYLSETVKHMGIRSAPTVSVGVSLKSGLLELKVECDDMSGEELAAILKSYRARKKWHRLKDGSFLPLDAPGIRQVEELAEGLGLTETQLRDGSALLPCYRAAYIDAVFREDASASENPGIQWKRSDYFEQLSKRMDRRNAEKINVPASLEGIMREYQKEGFQWLQTLRQYGFGGILADEMGLGKTLETIAFLLSEKEQAKPGEGRCPALIVCPASLVYNWENECRTFAPSLAVLPIVGSAQERKSRLAKGAAYDVLITSYDLLRRDRSEYASMTFSVQVIDEAQYIKNQDTQNARAVKSIRALFKLALTGTPVENRLSELWSIFDFLMPGFLYSHARFKSDFEIPIMKREDENALKRLHKMTGAFIMRRLKRDVLSDLPEKLEQVVYSRLEGTQNYLYQAAVLELKERLGQETEESFDAGKISILAQLTRLRQICCDPALCFENYDGESAKLDACMELVFRAVQSGHKLLLFSQFTSMLERIELRLKKEEIRYHKLTGATSREQRQEMIQSFQTDPVLVFLISLKAGGTGLNLTAADVVIHYDPWWNVAVQNQATDRAHRIGQKKAVTVYRLVAKDTIEEKILKLQESKKHLVKQVLCAKGASLASLSRRELMELL